MEILTKQQIDELWNKIDKKLSRVAISAREKLPYTTIDGVYDDRSHEGADGVDWWTNGFWAGMMWLMYAGTKNEEYKITARRSEELLDKALLAPQKLYHDVGFMWQLSSSADYQLTKNQKSFERSLAAANTLAGRYNVKGGYIRAWNGNGNEGSAIIDCMMNLPILYWASDAIGDDRYRYIAMNHADKTMANHVRPDGSVNHIIHYYPENGEIEENIGGQGYCEGSSWSRGQAWGLYGFTLSYIHTKEQRYLDTAKKIANYFIAACCDDYLPRCDFRSPAQPVIYDSSAGLIAACGLLELSKLVGEYEKDMYYNAACRFVKAAAENFTDWSDETDAIITHGTEAYHSDRHHIAMIYSDFYFVEAVNKLKGFNTFLW